MSRDRFISFADPCPIPVDVVKDLQWYGGDMFRAVTWMADGQRAIINLHGRFEKYGDSHPRWIEVVYGNDRHIDVLTREMDGPTNAIADDVARFIARRFKGAINPSDFPKPLMFSELEVNDYFICFPEDGDDSGHGGYRNGSYVFEKTGDCVKGNTTNNAIKLAHRTPSNMPAGMKVLKVLM